MVAQPSYSSARVAPVQRFTRNNPCPICGGWQGHGDWGFYSDDGRFAFCTAAVFAGALSLHPTTQSYKHLLDGACRCGVEHGCALSPDDLYERIPEATTPKRSHRDNPKPPTAIYAKYDNPNARKLRYGTGKGKYFVWQHADGQGDWINGLDGQAPGLYNGAALACADSFAPVYVTEGEGDAEKIIAAGGLAISPAGGADSWDEAYSERLRGFLVIVCGDLDENGKGQAHAQHVAERCAAHGAVARVIFFGDAHDVGDYLRAGHTLDEIRALATVAPIIAARTLESQNLCQNATLHSGETCSSCGSAQVSVQLVTSCHDCGAIERRDVSSETLESQNLCQNATLHSGEETRAEAPLDDLAAVHRLEGHIDAATTMNSSAKTVARAFLRAMRDLPHERRIVDPQTRRVQVVKSYRDEDGNVNIPAEFIAEYAGCSESTVYRHMPHIQHAGIAEVHQKTWYTEDGAPRKRNYYSLGYNATPRQEAPVFPEPLPEQPKRNGGARKRPERLVRVPDECEACRSHNVKVKATLVCSDCGHEETLKLNRAADADTNPCATSVQTQRCDTGTQEDTDRADLLAQAEALDWPRLPIADDPRAALPTRADLVNLAGILHWPRLALDTRGAIHIGPGEDAWHTFAAAAPPEQRSKVFALLTERFEKHPWGVPFTTVKPAD